MTHVTRLAAALAALALTTVLAACGGAGASLPGTSDAGGDPAAQILAAAPVAPDSAIAPGTLMAQIKQRGHLIYGGNNTDPLFDLQNPMTGQNTGFDALLARMLAKYITGKPDVTMQLVNIDTREALLQNGTVDAVLDTYTITPARAKKVDFAGPYYMSGDAIMVKKSNHAITSTTDLDGRTVASEQSSSALVNLKAVAPGANVITFQGNADCLQALQQGRVDAYVLDQAILLGDASRTPDVQLVGQPFAQEPYGIGTSEQHPEMKAFVDQWLKAIEQDGLWARVWQATVGTVIQGRPPAPPMIGSVTGS